MKRRKHEDTTVFHPAVEAAVDSANSWEMILKYYRRSREGRSLAEAAEKARIWVSLEEPPIEKVRARKTG